MFGTLMRKMRQRVFGVRPREFILRGPNPQQSLNPQQYYSYSYGDLTTSSPTLISEKPLICMLYWLFKQYIARGVKFNVFY